MIIFLVYINVICNVYLIMSKTLKIKIFLNFAFENMKMYGWGFRVNLALRVCRQSMLFIEVRYVHRMRSNVRKISYPQQWTVKTSYDVTDYWRKLKWQRCWSPLLWRRHCMYIGAHLEYLTIIKNLGRQYTEYWIYLVDIWSDS